MWSKNTFLFLHKDCFHVKNKIDARIYQLIIEPIEAFFVFSFQSKWNQQQNLYATWLSPFRGSNLWHAARIYGFSQICWGKIFARIFIFLYIHNLCIAQFLQESIWILAKSPEGESLQEWILAKFLALPFLVFIYFHLGIYLNICSSIIEKLRSKLTQHSQNM